MKTTNKGPAIEEIADRLTITEMIHRYCRAMDHIDAELDHLGA